MSGNTISQCHRPSDWRRPAFLGVFAFSSGVILLYWLAMMPPPGWLLPCIVVALVAAVRVDRPLCRSVFVTFAGLCLGLAWASWFASERLAERLPGQLEGEPVTVSGYLCDLPSQGSFNSLRFSFCVTRWHGVSVSPDQLALLPTLLRLAWYGRDGAGLPDHRLRLTVVLKRPHGALNPEGFRYEDWLFRKGYRATGSVRSVSADPDVPCRLTCQFHRAHGSLARWVDRQFGEREHHALIASLLIGNRGYMDYEHWAVLEATGTIHLVAISGLHLGLVALGAGLVARRLLLALPPGRVSERRSRVLAFSVVLVCCLFYALAAGFTVPTRRALIMVTVAGWSLLMARQTPVWQSLILALGLVLCQDPFAPLDQGFWLSFGAVSMLICVFAARLRAPGWLAGLVLSQGAVFAGLWPILSLVGQAQPLAGLLANLVAIPWVSLVVMPVLIIGGLLTALVPALAGAVGMVFDGVLDALWCFLSGVSRWHWPTLDAGWPEVIGFAVVVLLVVCLPLRAFRVLGFALIMAWAGATLTAGRPGNPFVADPEVRVWDVGQGLSVMIRHRRKVLLYDTGPEVKGVFSAVESVLIPNLRALGIRRIDELVISHGDNDHAGGLPQLLDAFDVGILRSGEPDVVQGKLLRFPDREVRGCDSETLTLGELSVRLWQAPGNLIDGDNDASCVVTVGHPASATEWILPGDITAGVEASHLRSMTSFRRPATRVVFAPHHGSKTSSSVAWVQAMQPDVVIYNAGYRHRFGHPHPEVVSRYVAVGARAFNTACSGQLVLSVHDGARLRIREMRDLASFWISGPGLARKQCKIP